MFSLSKVDGFEMFIGHIVA